MQQNGHLRISSFLSSICIKLHVSLTDPSCANDINLVYMTRCDADLGYLDADVLHTPVRGVLHQPTLEWYAARGASDP